MSKKVVEIEEVQIEETPVEETIEVMELEETKVDKAKRFAKKTLPAVGFTTVGVLIGVALTKRYDLIEDVINVIEPEVIESVVELGE